MAITCVSIRSGTPALCSLAEATAALGQGGVVWVDADERTPELDGLLARLQLHPLTIEDVFETRNVPKVEDFGAYLFVLAHAVRVPPQGPEKLQRTELDIVVGPGWIFTHHEPQLRAPGQVRDELLRQGKTSDCGRIAYLLLDRLVDDALPAMDAIDDA